MALAAQEIYPKECFGFVIGKGNEVTRIYTLQSVVNREDEVLFDYENLLLFKARIEMFLRGEEVIGTFHSHPGTDTVLAPSPADKKNLNFVPYLFIIWVPKHINVVHLNADGRWKLKQVTYAQVKVWKFDGKRLLRVKIVEKG